MSLTVFEIILNEWSESPVTIRLCTFLKLRLRAIFSDSFRHLQCTFFQHRKRQRSSPIRTKCQNYILCTRYLKSKCDNIWKHFRQHDNTYLRARARSSNTSADARSHSWFTHCTPRSANKPEIIITNVT